MKQALLSWLNGDPQASRRPGLDSLRALAIIWVVCYHYQIFVSHESSFGSFGDLGWVGVDLFFVLSGFLISNAVFADLARGDAWSAPRFIVRRMWRTLPAYYVVLAFYFVWPSPLWGKPPPALWRFMLFTQNLGLQPGTTFSHAWSLCVEEQFYMVLPVVILLGASLAKRLAWRPETVRMAGWALIAAGSTLAVLARSAMWDSYGGLHSVDTSAPYMTHLYYASQCRFDEFLPGISLAFIRHFHPVLWQRLIVRGRVWSVIAVAAVVGILTAIKFAYFDATSGYGYWMSVWGYACLAWSFAACVLAAMCTNGPLARLRIPGAAPLAAMSYSVYLSHKAVQQAMAALLGDYGWLPQESRTAWVIMGASCVVSGLLYWAIERTGLRLRDLWAPIRGAAQARLAHADQCHTNKLAQDTAST